ncbi:uncharacterized protein LOC110450146 [Mizuhopecten yessoensis]|uniref:Uncharacterized protein n=1 Tax=Mizuhopecten yessoensis TaxID=6573 RepID=A0A210QPM5_MIZYE|nr:uncharacterized protein LOC110450146 [Mizuhopecten yessoensis]OWF50696.1 hypothetical protein KP79_PYT18192 [Mizuhopecten yessoensis]
MALSNANANFLREHGLIAELGRPLHDFYFGIISKISGGDARGKTSDIQREPEFNLFFCAFKPEFLNQNQSTLYEPERIRQECLNRSKKHRTGPCRRDLYATAELLQQAIHLFHIREDVLKREIFLPPFCNFTPDNDRIIRILILSEGGKDVFYQLKQINRQENRRRAANTNQCDCNKFHAKLVEPPVPMSAGEPSVDQLIADHWVFSPPTANCSSLYRCLSKAIYGDESLFPLIRNLILKFEQQEDFLPVFQTFITEPRGHESADINTRTKNHFTQLSNGSKNPGTGEVYAASSLFCTDIYIWTENGGKWSVYHPLLLPTRTRHHFLTMAKCDNDEFNLLVPGTVPCNCQLARPPVESLKDERKRLESLAWGITAFKACCKGQRRHGPHAHLQFLASSPNQQDPDARRHTTASHTDYVDELLKLKGRRLDRVSYVGGTFQQCIYEEIYGTDEMVTTTQFPVPSGDPNDEEIRSTANWLKRPIYIFTKNRQNEAHKWKAFLPTPVSNRCRYYVTLYKDPETKRYDRVIPINGCNCSKFPPIEVRIPTEHGGRREIKKVKRHNPMLEYFLDENIEANMLTDENIYPAEDMNPPVNSVRSDIYHVQQRDDMTDRMVDTMDGKTSLFACLSKDIFGNSEKDNFIANLLLKEIRENGKTYSVLYSGSGKANEQADSLGSLQGFGEIDLLAAATFFQTRILVLLVAPDGTSRWKEFTQMRRKRRPQKLPQLQSTCSKGATDTNCVTLLRNAYGEFYRIVPKDNVCNCQMKQIRVPGKTNGSLRDGCTASVGGFGDVATEIPKIWAEKRKEAILKYRSLDFDLGQVYCDIYNLYRIVAFQLGVHEAIIRIFESRRRGTDITTITGSAVSGVGTAILVGGVAFAGATGGGSVAVAGMIVSVLGATSVAGGTLIEGFLSAKDLGNLIKIQNLLKVTSENLVASVKKIKRNIPRIDGVFRDEREILGNVNHDNLDRFGNFQIITGVCILEETCQAVSTVLSRLALRTSTVILGRLLAGFSLVLDGVLIALAARSLNKGSKTETSETLGKNAYQLRALKSILKTYIHKADQ